VSERASGSIKWGTVSELEEKLSLRTETSFPPRSLGGQLSHAIKDGNEGYFVAILGGLEELLINTRSELGDVAAANENTEHSGRTRMAQALLDVVFKI